MSRNIDVESVLSEDEIEYLTARGQFDVLAANAAYHINGTKNEPQEATSPSETSETVKSPETTGEPGSDESGEAQGAVLAHVEVADYTKYTKDELAEIFNERNAGRPENGLPLVAYDYKMNKGEIIATLLADDALVASR